MATSAALQSVLKPIEEADESDQDYKLKLKLKKTRFDRHKNDRIRRDRNPCKKPGHNHDWKDYPDNKYGSKYRGNESHAIEERQRNSSQEREITFEDHQKVNIMKMDHESENESGDEN